MIFKQNCEVETFTKNQSVTYWASIQASEASARHVKKKVVDGLADPYCRVKLGAKVTQDYSS